jgi:hypothetical protein
MWPLGLKYASDPSVSRLPLILSPRTPSPSLSPLPLLRLRWPGRRGDDWEDGTVIGVLHVDQVHANWVPVCRIWSLHSRGVRLSISGGGIGVFLQFLVRVKCRHWGGFMRLRSWLCLLCLFCEKIGVQGLIHLWLHITSQCNNWWIGIQIIKVFVLQI